MTIDKSGEFWRGTSPEDVDEYLEAYTADNYPVARVIHCVCPGGGAEMSLDADVDEGCARWTCNKCKTQRFIGDSEDYWGAATPEPLVCPECKGVVYELAVGFALREGGDVRWMTVGNRCVTCGLLGSFIDWKIDYSPTEHLFSKV